MIQRFKDMFKYGNKNLVMVFILTSLFCLCSIGTDIYLLIETLRIKK